MDTLLVGKIIYEACRARDNGHKVEGGRPDWFHLPDGAKANAKDDVEYGESEDPLAQAIMDFYGCKVKAVTKKLITENAKVVVAKAKPTPKPAAKKPPAKKPTKRKAKK